MAARTDMTAWTRLDLAARPATILSQLTTLLNGTGPGLTTVADHPVLAETPAVPGTIVLPTSGSTADPKLVHQSGAALRASGRATEEVLDGPGQWLLALPPHHVAGLQVWCRSALAGTTPVLLADGRFTPAAFAQAATSMDASVPRYVSLVPAQLHRLLDDPAAIEALCSMSAVLIGGAALPASEWDRATSLGVPVVRTYGMTETGGGCVYDGVPLPGVRVELESDARIKLSGPMLADGYLGADAEQSQAFTTDAEGTRWFRTSDAGVFENGRLQVTGRLDEVIVTGGHKVAPDDVEAALLTLPDISAATVVAVPDPEWGQLVAAALVCHDRVPGDLDPASLRQLRDDLRGRLPDHALPRLARVVPEIPLLSTGKSDRRQLSSAFLGAQDGTM